MPFSLYDTSHLAASNNFTENGNSSCPSGSTVRGCFQTILGQLKSQGVTGIRVFMTLCDSSSQAFVCGGNYQTLSWNPGNNPTQQTWITNVSNFFEDVAAAGIPNVTLTLAGNGPSESAPLSTLSSPTGSCSTSGNCCSDATSQVLFDPINPYGARSDTHFVIGDYWNTSSNQGYNCSPSNTQYFVGWTNILNVVGAVLAAAKGRVNIFELEPAQEIDPFEFTAQLRWIYDNSMPQSAPAKYLVTVNGHSVVNVLGAFRDLMSEYGFDPGRIAYSAQWSDGTDATSNCGNAYQDYARNNDMGNITQGINAGPVGVPQGYSVQHGLTCGGTINSSMLYSPIYSTQPDIVDLHIYPSVHGQQNTDAQIQQVAALDYGDVPHYLIGAGQTAAAIVIGETYGGAISALNLGSPSSPNYCWLGQYQSPSAAPTDNVAGFNNEGVAGPLSSYTVTFRPWMQLEDPSGQCFTYGSGPGTSGNYQTLNLNGAGPYTPTNR